MKPLLYLGAALMIGAGTYGFVDFKKKSHSKEMQSLYKKEETKEVKEPIPAPDIPEVVPAAMVTTQKEAVVEIKDTVAAGNKVGKKNNKRFNLKIYSRAEPRAIEEFEEEVPAAETDTIKATQ